MSITTEEIHACPHGNVGLIIFDAPGANLLTIAGFKRIATILDEYKRDPFIEAVGFIGARRKNFCGGANLKWMQSLQHSSEVGNETIDAIYQIGLMTREFPKPTIAAIEDGACCGVGFELAMLCDYIVAMKKNAPSILFGALAIRYGFMLGLGASWRLARKIGVPNAARFLVRSDTTDLAIAWKLGIVDAFLWGDDFKEAVFQFAQSVLEGKIPESPPPFAPKLVTITDQERKVLAPECSKLTLCHTLRAFETCTQSKNFEEAMKLDKAYFKKLFFSENAKEGVSAFLEKRKPKFIGGIIETV